MKHILCYGDSNTHGFIPWGGRYDDNTRWTCLLAKMLGSEYRIIDEGLNGRTTAENDPLEAYRNGLSYLVPCLQTHLPVDLTILMLGSNDMKDRFCPTAEKIADNLYRMTSIIKEMTQAPVLLVSPILLGPQIVGGDFSKESLTVSAGLASAIEKRAKKLDVAFLNAADYADPSPSDGLHLEPEGHRAIADVFYQKIKEILN
jgi:lysophospholipase L1-like esterase